MMDPTVINDHINSESKRLKKLTIPVFEIDGREVVTKDSLKFGVLKPKKTEINKFFNRKESFELESCLLKNEQLKKIPYTFRTVKNNNLVVLVYVDDLYIALKEIVKNEDLFEFRKTNLKIEFQPKIEFSRKNK